MMRRRLLKGIGSIPLLAFSFGVTGGEAQERRFKGPLRIHPKNPRYFTDDGKRAIYLTGSNTWSNLQDIGLSDPPPAFDFNAYLDFLVKYNHNFIRLWRWEVPRYRYSQGALSFCEPHPWLRTGPGTAEARKRKQHHVGMTFQYQGGTNENLFNSPADWISPNPGGGYRDDPPPNDGRKIVLNDTDHLWGEVGNPQWCGRHLREVTLVFNGAVSREIVKFKGRQLILSGWVYIKLGTVVRPVTMRLRSFGKDESGNITFLGDVLEGKVLGEPGKWVRFQFSGTMPDRDITSINLHCHIQPDLVLTIQFLDELRLEVFTPPKLEVLAHTMSPNLQQVSGMSSSLRAYRGKTEGVDYSAYKFVNGKLVVPSEPGFGLRLV